MIVTWQGRSRLTECLDAVADQARPHKTIVVDNGSTDGTSAVVARHPSSPRVLRLRTNTGYAGGLAAALRLVDTPLVAWLNDDARPDRRWLAELEDALLADPTAAAVSPCLRRQDGSVQSLGVRLTADGHGADIAGRPAERSGSEPFEVFAFCGGAALLRAAALRSAGGVPGEFFCYYEDTDTAWRLRLAGWRVLAVPAAGVRHLHAASTGLGSVRFHLWNERNRLLTLARCAPARVAARQWVRFACLTLVLPWRRLRVPSSVPGTANFRVRPRSRALAGAVVRLPAAVRARLRAGGRQRRAALWARWAGR
ncbi:glycosyltransferase family 2 protein [Haloechinothrix sp. YIM 98757]|uniref:Glycosyltransferase family 2 protein n=1 Tax=Haloechinothrix aidingensis TaxID=2752311 RepID=A0A838AFE2_9PSEU|nr:glycosyltransferase family 2 protein [Haloechinothrix aidingensis]